MPLSDTAPVTTARRHNEGKLPIGAVVVVNISFVTFRVGSEPVCRAWASQMQLQHKVEGELRG